MLDKILPKCGLPVTIAHCNLVLRCLRFANVAPEVALEFFDKVSK